MRILFVALVVVLLSASFLVFRFLFLIAIFCLLASIVSSNCHEPGSDPDSEWFRKLKHQGESCCNMTDCHRTEDWRQDAAGHYSVWLDGTWTPVADDRVLRGVGNPTGAAVACYPNFAGPKHIRCFVPPVTIG